jgi:hypothetical protein
MSFQESVPLIDPDDSPPSEPEKAEVDPDHPLDPPEESEHVDPDRPLDPLGGPEIETPGYPEAADQI